MALVVEICASDLRLDRLWDEYVERRPSAGHSHLSGWRRVIETAYGHRGLYLWARENGTVRGVLPMILMRSVLRGRSLVSLPFLDDGGICADNDEMKAALHRAAIQLFEDCHAGQLHLRHRLASGLNIPAHGSKVTFGLDLSRDWRPLWTGLGGNVRNHVRKAIKSGLEAVWSDRAGLPEFYDVFARNMRELGSPVHSREFFGAILGHFPDTAKLMLVRKDGQTIGAGVCLAYKGTVIVPWASSLREYFTLSPNSLLYWELIRWACENGYRRFDFGRSSPGSGTYQFKKDWGTVEEPLHWQCVQRRAGRSTVVDGTDSRYRWAARTWRLLPLVVTRWIGPLIRRHLSN